MFLAEQTLNVARHVIQAARSPVNLDDRQVNAVAARIELDLRIGYAFTRLQTNSLKPLGGPLKGITISYGWCLLFGKYRCHDV
jgi:DNA topoisomerase III